MCAGASILVCFLQRKSILRVSLCDEVERQLKAKAGSKVKTNAGCGQFQTTKGDLKNNLDAYGGMRTRRPKGLDSEPRHPVVARHTAHAQNQKVRAQRNVKRWQPPEFHTLVFWTIPDKSGPAASSFYF